MTNIRIEMPLGIVNIIITDEENTVELLPNEEVNLAYGASPEPLRHSISFIRETDYTGKPK